MGWSTGLEPATTSATNWRSTNWTTVTITILGAGNEARTRDIQLGRLTLYQLSYSRKKGNIIKSVQNNGRCSRIRTCGPLLPRQVRYRTAPCTDFLYSIGQMLYYHFLLFLSIIFFYFFIFYGNYSRIYIYY